MQLFLKLNQEFVDHAQNNVTIKRCEGDCRIETVSEFRGEEALDLGHFIARLLGVGKAHARFLQVGRAGVGRHDDHDVAEISLASVVVSQRAVIHHLQQNIEDIRMRLLDFIKQQHAVGLLGYSFGQ